MAINKMYIMNAHSETSSLARNISDVVSRTDAGKNISNNSNDLADGP